MLRWEFIIIMVLFCWRSFCYSGQMTIKASALLCPNQCGDVGIEYPFGIGDGCYFDKSFEVVCDNTSSGSPKAVIKSINLEISPQISYGSGLPYIAVNVSVISLNGSNNIANANGVNMTGTPFSFSQNNNRFTAMGCDKYTQKNDSTGGGCLSMCTCDPPQNGTDCCDLSCTIPPNSKVFNANTSYEYSQSINQECTSVSMVEQDWLFRSYYSSQSNPIVLKDQEKVPAVLEWGKGKGSCFEEYNSHTTICNKDNDKASNSSAPVTDGLGLGRVVEGLDERRYLTKRPQLQHVYSRRKWRGHKGEASNC